MQVKIAFRGMNGSPALESLIHTRAARLEALHRRIQRCEVIVEAPHLSHRHGNRCRVRVALTLPRGRIDVSHEPGPDGAGTDYFLAVRDAFRAVRRRLNQQGRRALREQALRTHALRGQVAAAPPEAPA